MFMVIRLSAHTASGLEWRQDGWLGAQRPASPARGTSAPWRMVGAGEDGIETAESYQPLVPVIKGIAVWFSFTNMSAAFNNAVIKQ